MRLFLALLSCWAGAAQASSLDRTSIEAVLRRAAPHFKRCYEAALKQAGPGLAGKAVMRFTVSHTGQVREVTIEFSIGDGGVAAPLFVQCLRDRALRVQFPAGPDTYKLVWPVAFRSD